MRGMGVENTRWDAAYKLEAFQAGKTTIHSPLIMKAYSVNLVNYHLFL